jgi:ribosome-associated heat shock protein Hsp15
VRIDKLLWFLRLAKTRGAAQQWVEEGPYPPQRRAGGTLPGQRGVGDVLVLPLPQGCG